MAWETEAGRWSDPRNDLVAAQFRRHVDTPGNRRAGRSCLIVREPCWFCQKAADETTKIAKEEDPTYEPPALRPGQFHHFDYLRPFYGVWVCCRHHRMIDHGSLIVPKTARRDYLKLVRNRLRPERSGQLNPMSATNRKKEVPF